MNWENTLILKSAINIAKKTKADAVMVHADPLDDLSFTEKIPKKIDLFLLSRKKRIEAQDAAAGTLAAAARGVVQLPRINLTRIALIKVATTLALSRELIKPGSNIVFAVGGADSGVLDMIQRVDISKESEIITGIGITKIAGSIRPEVFQTILNLVIELADKGREGKAVGTTFVVGDHEKVLQLSKQMIMNPFKGYDEEERNILSSSLKETIREFSAMDGAFVISNDGVVLTAGRYLGVAYDGADLPRGLGTRHNAAAGITTLTQALAFVISESSGDVRIFKDGKVIMHIEKAETRKK